MDSTLMMNLRWTTEKGMSASLTVQAETHVELHDRLIAAMTAVIKPAGNPRANGAEPAAQSEHQCQEHHVAFDRHSNDRGTWYSHPKDDGGWCREKNGGK